MDDGWIKSSRSIIDSAIFQDAYLLKMWIYLLHKVTHKPLKRMVDGNAITLMPGQWIMSTRKLAEALNCSAPTVTKHLKQLEALESITRKFIGNSTIITVVNWEKYQVEDQGVKRGVKRGVKSSYTQVCNSFTQKQEVVKQENNNYYSDDCSIEKLNAVAANDFMPSKEVLEHLDKCHFEISTRNLEELQKLENQTSTKWIVDAIQIADDNGHRSVGYVKGIISRWKENGESTLSREKEEERKKKEKDAKKELTEKREEEWLAYVEEGHNVDFFEYAALKGWEV